MATTNEYIEYVCEQLRDFGDVRYKKMFGEFMVYIDDKPIVIVCDNTPFIKKVDSIANMMNDAQTGYPYNGAKEHYILDIENMKSCEEAINELVRITAVPKPKKKLSKK